MALLLSFRPSSIVCRRNRYAYLHSFLQHRAPTEKEINDLVHFVKNSSNLICITGAGVSTSSGLPDYRGINGSYKRGHKPMVHGEFVNSHSMQQRYWSRAMIGWDRMKNSEPNDAHRALRDLEQHCSLNLIITQNVDTLHQKAGSRNVVDLHGRMDEVICRQCGTVSSRAVYHDKLRAANEPFSHHIATLQLSDEARADGDAELGDYDISTFCVPGCSVCGGVVKPHVVFFGDNVPLKKVEDAYAEIEKADALLVVGTSLEVFSAYRFVLRADKLGIPIAIINHGETRAERSKLASVKYKSDACCGMLLKAVAQRVTA